MRRTIEAIGVYLISLGKFSSYPNILRSLAQYEPSHHKAVDRVEG
jgi:hypothetical protein